MSSEEICRILEENLKTRILCAIAKDDVDALKDVLNSLPEFHTLLCQDQNLLHLSCHFRKKKTFDYLLNLNCFDLEMVNDWYKKTVLEDALCDRKGDYFGVRLINAGADVHKICYDKGTYLHRAICYSLFESAELLIKKGVDINAQDRHGCTPSHLYLKSNSSRERLDWLLQYGADTAIPDKRGYLPFDYAFIFGNELHVQEHLFHCTFDSHSDYKIQSRVLAALMNSPLFDSVMDIVSEVTDCVYLPLNIFVIPRHILKRFIEQCDYVVEEVLSRVKPHFNMAMESDNVELLLNSRLQLETVQLIATLELERIFFANRERMSEEKLSTLILYLLSYGLNVTNVDCQKIYESRGYSDLFKTMLLHLDDPHTLQNYAPMANIIIDIHCNLSTTLRSFKNFSSNNRKLLLDFFADSELRLLCKGTGKRSLINKVKQVPVVPSLLQLARDETRRHIVRRFKLEKTSQYYWALRKLGIGATYEKILSFETKLYG